MLRIINSSTVTVQRWILCGQIAGRWVREFRSNWVAEIDGAHPRRRIVDLTEVTFVDESGEALLRELKGEGAEFVGDCGVETRDLVENLRAGGISPVRKNLSRLEECG
jgi:anti-anti-sigma regulatory factor